MMSGIRSRNTRPEIRIRKLLHHAGFRFRLHRKDLPGKPDIVLPRFRAVILIQGCFWHGHGCSLFKWPSTRAEWWRNKIQSNQRHDEKVRNNLHAMGWRICEVWECALKGRGRLSDETIVESVSAWLTSGAQLDLEIRESIW